MPHVKPGNTPQQQQANTLRVEYQRLMKDIRDDRTLSPHGQQKKLAALYLDYKPRLEKLGAEEDATRQTRAKDLRRDLFGLPGYADPNTAISYRDAQDRAANVGDEQTALRLLSRAEISGDTSLAKALAARALDEGWNAAINQYADATPGSEAKFNELIDIESHGKGSSGMAQILGAAMAYTIEKPSELNMYNMESQLASLANSDS